MKAQKVPQSPDLCCGGDDLPVEKQEQTLSVFPRLPFRNKCTIVYNTGREGQS